jgi:SAM-dependent methyltransferase
MNSVNCIVCRGPTSTGWVPWHVVCSSCDYEQSDLTPTINESQAYALVNEADRERSLKTLRLENFNVIVERASRLVAPEPSRLLDVGSAHGWFLEAASAHFQVLGIEPDSAVGGKAAARGLPVRQGYFPDALQNDEQFDVIVFNDVLEHIPDIQSALIACKHRLTPGGILVINLPSSRGFFYRLSKVFLKVGWQAPFERMWQKGLPSPHVHYFNDKNLNTFVCRFGFDLVERFELPSLQSRGLMERLRFVAGTSKLVLYVQYLILRCVIPLLRLCPSDIVVCIFRNRLSLK